MSSRECPIPRELQDEPANPFLPSVPPLAALRTRIARRRPTLPHATASAPAGLPSIPFGEIGRENDDDFDVMSVLSGGVSDLDIDAESAAFVPRVRDLQTRRPIVRRRMTTDVAARAAVGGEPESKHEPAARDTPEHKDVEKSPSTEPEAAVVVIPMQAALEECDPTEAERDPASKPAAREHDKASVIS